MPPCPYHYTDLLNGDLLSPNHMLGIAITAEIVDVVLSANLVGKQQAD